eukprot:scaffold879_cov161-Skeletonema_marinoi.AAC.2
MVADRLAFILGYLSVAAPSFYVPLKQERASGTEVVTLFSASVVGGRRQEAKNNELDTFFHLKFCCLSLLVKKSRAKKGSHPDLICISLSAFRFPYTLLQYQQNPSSRYVNKQH